jgi:hypothetical protein
MGDTRSEKLQPLQVIKNPTKKLQSSLKNCNSLYKIAYPFEEIVVPLKKFNNSKLFQNLKLQ